MTHYVSSKAGVIGLTKSLALEFGPKGITVNTIPPGFIDTPMLRDVRGQGPARRGRRAPRDADAGAPGRPARGHRRHLLLPRARRGQLRHRPGHRRQRRPQHLRSALARASFSSYRRVWRESQRSAFSESSITRSTGGTLPTWRETDRRATPPRPIVRARGARWPSLGRSIPARARAEERVQRFLDAAVELMMQNDTGQGLHRPGRGRALRAVAAQLLPVLRRQARAAAGAVRGVGPLDGRAPEAGGRRGRRPARAAPPLRRRALPGVPADPEGRGRPRRAARRPRPWPSSASGC